MDGMGSNMGIVNDCRTMCKRLSLLEVNWCSRANKVGRVGSGEADTADPGFLMGKPYENIYVQSYTYVESRRISLI